MDIAYQQNSNQTDHLSDCLGIYGTFREVDCTCFSDSIEGPVFTIAKELHAKSERINMKHRFPHISKGS